MSKERKSASAKTQQHIEETAYINSVLNTNANAQANTVSKTTIEFVRNATKWPEEDILRVLKDSGNDPQLAINKILDGLAGNPTQWTEVQGKRTPKVEPKPNKPNKPANGVQSRDGGGKTYKTDEKRDDKNQEKKREARKRPPRNAPGNNQEQNQQIAQPQGQPQQAQPQQAQPQVEAKHKESEVQTNQGSSQNATTSVPSQTKPTRSSKENGTTSKQSVSGWGKPPASIYTDSHQQPLLPVVNQVSQPPLQTQSVAVETMPVANPSTEKPKQDNLPRWGPQSKSQTAPPITQAPSSTTSPNANASPASSSPQVQSSESQLAEVQPVQQTSQATTQASKSSPSTAPRQGYHPPSIKAWKPKDAKAPNEQPQTSQIQAVSQPTQAVPTPQVSVPQTQSSQTQPQQSSQAQPPKPTPTTTPTNKLTPVPYTPVVNERSAVILPPSSVALIGGNTHDVHFGVFGSTYTDTTQTRTESTRTPTTQYQAAHATEVSHAHPHTDRLGVDHLHIAEAYSPDHQAPQMEDPHANQIPPYFLPPSYIPTFAPQFTYETDPSIRAMHVYDPNQVQGYQPHGLGYQQGIPDSKYGENNYAENKYGAPESSNTTQNPQATQSQGPQTQQPQHPAYYSSPIYGPYPYPPNQYSFQNPSVTPSQYLPPRFYQRPFPANYPGNSAYLQPGAPTGVQPGTTHTYPGAEEQDVYKSPVQFSVPMSSYFMPPEANPSMLGKPSQTSAPKGQSQVNYSQGNPTPQATEQNQTFKTNQSAYQPGNNPRESYYNMQQPQYGQVQGQSNYAFPVPQVQTQPQVQSQSFPRGQYQ